MPYTFTQDVPINRQMYGKLIAELGSDAPKGLISHLAMTTDNGLRYVEVWESKADYERFIEERVHPALARVLANAEMPRPPEPEIKEFELVELWQPGPAQVIKP
jgi:hypothetical protein